MINDKDELLKNKKELIRLCIEMENDLNDNEIIIRNGRMSILFFLAITEEEIFPFFRHDITNIDRDEILIELTQGINHDVFALCKEKLFRYDCDETYWGATYIFDSSPSPISFPDVTVIKQNNNYTFVIIKDGLVVSKAFTWGENLRAAEVEVETLEDYRRKGFGKQTVSAWANWQVNNSRIAFFSHEYSNIASEILAKKLNLQKIASILIYYQRRSDLKSEGRL